MSDLSMKIFRIFSKWVWHHFFFVLFGPGQGQGQGRGQGQDGMGQGNDKEGRGRGKGRGRVNGFRPIFGINPVGSMFSFLQDRIGEDRDDMH